MADETEAIGSDESEKGKAKHRSPNYPLFDLEKAVELAKKLYDIEKMHKVPIGVAHERWGYKKHSAAGNQAVGAMKSYGLVGVEGVAEKRLVTITDAARRIILNTPERPELIKESALGPDLFRSLWERYGAVGLPSDDVLSHYLILDRKFNDDSVRYAVDRFKSTVVYAKLSAGDKIEGVEADGEHEPATMDPPISDRKKRRVMPSGIKEDVFSLDEGSVVLQWPAQMSKTSAEDMQDWLNLIGRKIKRAADNASLDTDKFNSAADDEDVSE